MNIKKAIENVRTQIENTKQANECGLATKGEFDKDIEALETVLEELQKKDRIIDLMTNYIYDKNVKGAICSEKWKEDCEPCDKCIKQYFEKKVEEK